MLKSSIKNPKLASSGANQVSWARSHMPALLEIERCFAREKPFKNLRIGMALHVTKETAVLVETLQAGGAKVAIASCNPLSTQDDVAAYLAKKGSAGNNLQVFAYKGETKSDYYKFIRAVVETKPHITIDDGCDLITEIHLRAPGLIPGIIGGCEETTTGINRLKAMEKDGALKYPMVAVNDNKTKHMFDNFYGTGQSTWDGILRATNILVAGKTVVVAGYGDCGRGIAEKARGLGAHVIVTEIDPVRALQSSMDGFRTMKMEEAATLGDVFITATGGKHVINQNHMRKMKSGAILANSGHFNIEIDVEGLERLSAAKKQIRPFVMEYSITQSTGRNSAQGNAFSAAHRDKKGSPHADAATLYKKLYLLGEGRLINLAAAEGHPSEVMDLSFCGQALACEWLVKNRGGSKGEGARKLRPKVYTLPPEIDIEIAQLKLKSLGLSIDSPTPEQKKYGDSWQEGT